MATGTVVARDGGYSQEQGGGGGTYNDYSIVMPFNEAPLFLVLEWLCWDWLPLGLAPAAAASSCKFGSPEDLGSYDIIGASTTPQHSSPMAEWVRPVGSIAPFFP